MSIVCAISHVDLHDAPVPPLTMVTRSMTAGNGKSDALVFDRLSKNDFRKAVRRKESRWDVGVLHPEIYPLSTCQWLTVPIKTRAPFSPIKGPNRPTCSDTRTRFASLPTTSLSFPCNEDTLFTSAPMEQPGQETIGSMAHCYTSKPTRNETCKQRAIYSDKPCQTRQEKPMAKHGTDLPNLILSPSQLNLRLPCSRRGALSN